MFLMIGIIISSFLFALLVLKKNKSYADRILTIWMAVMALHQILYYLHFTGLTYQYPHLLGLLLPWPVVHSALLYLYVYAMTHQKPLKWFQVLPHFIPFLVLVVLAIPFYSQPSTVKLEVFENNGAGYEWYSMIQMGMMVGLGLAYVLWSLFRIHRHRVKVKQWFSNAEKMTLRWLEYLTIGLGAIWVLVFFFDDFVIYSGVVVLVIFIGLFGINQVPIFYAHQDILDRTNEKDALSFDEFNVPEMDNKTELIRYAKSGLKEENSLDLHQRLTALMKDKALYKRNDITLADLAGLLDTHPNYLSQVINEREEKNFYHYINSLRVQAFIEAAALPNKQHYSYLAIALECGFNSKSTFNKYFKAYSGKSPSAYFSK